MYLYACLREYKSLIVGTLVRKEEGGGWGATAGVGAEIHVGSFCTEPPDCFRVCDTPWFHYMI